MTPKHRKKLTLDRLTLRSLESRALAGVGGGFNKSDPRGPCSYTQYYEGGICADTGTYHGTDGCPSGVYSGCEGVC